MILINFLFLKSGQNENKRDKLRISDLNSIKFFLELYYIDHGFYPSESGNSREGTGIWKQLNSPLAPKYIGWVPGDPLAHKGFTYTYTTPDPNKSDKKGKSWQLKARLETGDKNYILTSSNK